jgi:uncharacterized RDD family membrane protein YckC
MTDTPGPEQDAVQLPPTQVAPEWGADLPPGTESPTAGSGLPQAPPPPPGYGAPPPPSGYGAPVPSTGYGAPVPPGMYFDVTSGLMLPNGTQLATVGRRIGAYFLAIPLVIVTLGIGYVIWGLIVWAQGTTPALQVLGMRCWRPQTGQVASFGVMALREIIGRIVDNILGFITGLVSFFLFLTGKERKALHDHVAGTVVLYDPDKVLPK